MRCTKFGWAVLLGLLMIVGLSTTQALRAQSSAAAPRSALAEPLGTWSPEFAQGIETLGQVTAIITTTSGDLYIAGAFEQVAGVDARGIARWDGTQWLAVAPSRPPGLIIDIAIYHDEIYVVTDAVHQTQSAGLWRYNGTNQQWNKIGFPSFVDTEMALGNIRNLTVFNDLLIVGGYFELMNAQTLPGIVAWNGTSFQAIAPRPTFFYTADVVITPTGLVVAGTYRDPQTEESHSYLGRWDGTAWYELTSPLPTVTELAWESNKLYIFNGSNEIQALTNTQWSHVSTISGYNPTFIGVIGGRPYTRTCDYTCGTLTLQRWQGDTPETLGSYRPYGQAYNRGMTRIIDGVLYVGGANTLADGSKHALMRYHDGTLSGVFGRIVSVGPPHDLALDQGRLYIVTAADFTGALTASNGMTWESGTWTRWWPTDPQRQTTNLLKHVRVLAHDDLLIGGHNLTISPTQTTALARSTQGQLANLDPQRHCQTISTTVYSASNLLGVCQLFDSPSREIAISDGTQWSHFAGYWLADPDAEGWIDDISQIGYHQRLYGLVREAKPYSTPADSYYVYAWSDDGWAIVTIENAPMRALAQASGDLYVANANLYRAIGNGFEPIATTDGTIRTILVKDDRIWIGGEFSQVNGVAANNIAQWDGLAWHALGEGTNGRVAKLDYDSGMLAVGGFFTRAGGVRANGISLWQDQAVLEPAATIFLPSISR